MKTEQTILGDDWCRKRIRHPQAISERPRVGELLEYVSSKGRIPIKVTRHDDTAGSNAMFFSECDGGNRTAGMIVWRHKEGLNPLLLKRTKPPGGNT